MNSKVRHFPIVFVVAGTISFLTMPALAEIVHNDFIGSVTSSNCSLPSIAVGTPVTGSLSYDSTIPPNYNTGSVAGYVGSDGRVKYSITLGGVTVQNDEGSYSLQVLNNSFGSDGFNGFFSSVSGGVFDTIRFNFSDSTGNVFSSTALPDSLDLSNFTFSTGTLTCGTGGSVFFSIDELVPLPTPVAIDIKPGSDPNCFNINGHGIIPVAILGSEELIVDDIVVSSETPKFNGLKVRVRGNKGPTCSVEDSNGDGYLDLVCHFEDDPSQWIEGVDGNAKLSGKLVDGTLIEGTDSICIVP